MSSTFLPRVVLIGVAVSVVLPRTFLAVAVGFSVRPLVDLVDFRWGAIYLHHKRWR